MPDAGKLPLPQPRPALPRPRLPDEPRPHRRGPRRAGTSVAARHPRSVGGLLLRRRRLGRWGRLSCRRWTITRGRPPPRQRRRVVAWRRTPKLHTSTDDDGSRLWTVVRSDESNEPVGTAGFHRRDFGLHHSTGVTSARRPARGGTM